MMVAPLAGAADGTLCNGPEGFDYGTGCLANPRGVVRPGANQACCSRCMGQRKSMGLGRRRSGGSGRSAKKAKKAKTAKKGVYASSDCPPCPESDRF